MTYQLRVTRQRPTDTPTSLSFFLPRLLVGPSTHELQRHTHAAFRSEGARPYRSPSLMLSVAILIAAIVSIAVYIYIHCHRWSHSMTRGDGGREIRRNPATTATTSRQRSLHFLLANASTIHKSISTLATMAAISQTQWRARAGGGGKTKDGSSSMAVVFRLEKETRAKNRSA